MKSIKMSEEARKRRNEYQRKWKRNNPDKARKYNVDYWERKATSENDNLETKILKLHEQNFSLRDIAEKTNVSHMKVSRILNKCNSGT